MQTWTYESFQKEKLRFDYITDPLKAKNTLRQINRFPPKSVAVDFETTKDKIRLIQLGFDVPGYHARQMVIDCNAVNSSVCRDLFQNKNLVKLIHFSRFEQKWATAELGVAIENVFDTCLAWRTIQSHCKAMIQNGQKETLQKVLPAYFPHKNTLQSLCEHYLGFSLPKEEQASDWGQSQLSESQVVYAAMDVAVLPPLARHTYRVARVLNLLEQVENSIQKVTEGAKETVGEAVEAASLF